MQFLMFQLAIIPYNVLIIDISLEKECPPYDLAAVVAISIDELKQITLSPHKYIFTLFA